MKKIMFFIPYGMDTPGGAERILSTIANELVKDDYCKVDIVTFNSTKSFYKLNDNINIHSLNLKKSKNYFARKLQPLKYVFGLRKIIKKIDPSVIISLSIEAVFLKLIATIGLTSIDKKISWEHNSYYQPTYKLLKSIRYISYRFLDLIVVLNETDYNAFKSAALTYYTDNNKMPAKKDELKSFMDTVPQDSAFGGAYELTNTKDVDGDKTNDELVLTITGAKITQEQMKKLVKDIGQDKIYVDGTAMTASNAKAVDSGTIDIVLIDNTNM